MHKHMYDFSMTSYDTVEQAAEAAVNRIYSAGIMVWDNQVVPGGNNVMAGSAAKAFNAATLDTLKQSPAPYVPDFAAVIALRQQFEDVGNGYGRDGRALLQQIYDKVQQLKTAGWQPQGEPHRRTGPRPV